MSTATAETLRAARALIDAPEKWTRGFYARDTHGVLVYPTSRDAVCFCIQGALRRVVASDGFTRLTEDAENAISRALLRSNWEMNPPDFNDDPETTHADVLAAFDCAIAAEEATP